MTVKEADRAAVMLAVLERRLKQREAAEHLGLGVRQVKRLAKRRREARVHQSRPRRALKTLDIEPIHASTPQAKGRVERANLTLQDRLVKEMRLLGIDGTEAANSCLPEFMADFNRRFAAAPCDAADAHRPVPHGAEELDLILCEQATRKLSRNLTFKFERREFQLVGEGKGRRLRGAAVTVCKGFDGTASVLLKGRRLAFRVLAEGGAAVAVAGGKDVRDRVDAAKAAQAARLVPHGAALPLLCLL